MRMSKWFFKDKIGFMQIECINHTLPYLGIATDMHSAVVASIYTDRESGGGCNGIRMYVGWAAGMTHISEGRGIARTLRCGGDAKQRNIHDMSECLCSVPKQMGFADGMCSVNKSVA